MGIVHTKHYWIAFEHDHRIGKNMQHMVAPSTQMDFSDHTYNHLPFALIVFSDISWQADLLLLVVDASSDSTSLRAAAVHLLQSSASLTQLKASRKARL